MSTRIYIPTRGRVGYERQATLREFVTYSSHKPVLVCPPDEVALHRRYWPRVLGCTAVPPGAPNGIGLTRQWILDNSTADVVIMADDDMWFSYRPDPASTRLEKSEDLDPMVRFIEELVAEGYIHGGVGARQGNNHKDGTSPRKGIFYRGHMIQDNERVNNLHFYNRPAVLATGVRLTDAPPVVEDFYMTLSLLTRGHPNVVIHDYVWNQRGSGQGGGCSLYRTASVQEAGAEGLKAAFPDFVRVVEKVNKDTSNAWKDFKVRKDVVVQWQRAFESSGGGR